MADALFEDGAEKPIRLKALDNEDLGVISSLVQDAIVPTRELKFDGGKRRFAFLLNRFRWEDVDAAQNRQRDFERVQSLLFVEDVISAKSQGFDKSDPDMILSVLSLDFKAHSDGTGVLNVTFAGDGQLALTVEALEVGLQDVTKPYVAPSGKKPAHT